MRTEKIILFPPSYEERLKTTKEKIESAELAYRTLRGQCKHERKVWKDKYHGHYCEVCEKFLPRTIMDTKEYNDFAMFEHKYSAIFGIFKRLTESEKVELLRRLESREKPVEKERLAEKYLEKETNKRSK